MDELGRMARRRRLSWPKARAKRDLIRWCRAQRADSGLHLPTADFLIDWQAGYFRGWGTFLVFVPTCVQKRLQKRYTGLPTLPPVGERRRGR